jgi:hypothetical protein
MGDDKAAGKASFMEMVRYADAHDMCLMVLGVLGSFGDGMMQPLTMLVLGDIVNSYGAAGTADSGSFSSHAVDKVRRMSEEEYTPQQQLCPCHEFVWRAYSCRACADLSVRASVAVCRDCSGRLRFSR